MERETTKESRWPLFLLIGCLSMVIAELFAGSSLIWFIDPWSLVVTFPLYLGHLLFFLNLAMRTKRTSIPQLYLWGVLFGLYESWITKVVWFGYPGSDGPSIALVAGIAILEFITVVFFWHPVMAFITPILFFESFTLNSDSRMKYDQRVFPSHSQMLNKNNMKSMLYYVIIMIFGACFLSNNSGFDLITVLIAGLGSFALIYLFCVLSLRKNTNSFGIHSLYLNKRGMIILTLYLGGLYLITSMFLLPERFPTDLLPYLIIIGFYIFVGLMIKITKPVEESLERFGIDEIHLEDYIESTFFFKIYFVFIMLASVLCVFPVLGTGITFGIFLGIFFLGPVFFIILLIIALKSSRH